MGQLTFVFGVEMEMLVKPKAGVDVGSSGEKLFQRLVAELSKDGIQAYTKAAKDPLSNSESWAVTSDSSLNEGDGFFGAEMISPLLDSKNVKGWKKQIELIWKAIERIFDLKRDASCGTHIHMSPLPEKSFLRKPNQLRSLYKSIVIFDQSAITSIIPADRKYNDNCRSNTSIPHRTLYTKYNDSLQAKATNAPIFKWIDDIPTDEEFVDEMSPKRYCAWNARPSLKLGSVEFRRPPQVMNREEAEQWISIALCFAWYSIMQTGEITSKFGTGKATSDDLRRCLYTAASSSRLGLKPGVLEDV